MSSLRVVQAPRNKRVKLSHSTPHTYSIYPTSDIPHCYPITRQISHATLSQPTLLHCYTPHGQTVLMSHPRSHPTLVHCPSTRSHCHTPQSHTPHCHNPHCHTPHCHTPHCHNLHCHIVTLHTVTRHTVTSHTVTLSHATLSQPTLSHCHTPHCHTPHCHNPHGHIVTLHTVTSNPHIPHIVIFYSHIFTLSHCHTPQSHCHTVALSQSTLLHPTVTLHTVKLHTAIPQSTQEQFKNCNSNEAYLNIYKPSITL